jgi:hypothetical protein
MASSYLHNNRLPFQVYERENPKIPIGTLYRYIILFGKIAFCFHSGVNVMIPFLVIILWPFVIFCGHVLYFVDICCILLLFGIFYDYLVCCTNENLATLVHSQECPLGSNHSQAPHSSNLFALLLFAQTFEFFLFSPKFLMMSNNCH